MEQFVDELDTLWLVDRIVVVKQADLLVVDQEVLVDRGATSRDDPRVVDLLVGAKQVDLRVTDQEVDPLVAVV